MRNVAFFKNPLIRPSPPVLEPTELLECAHPDSREIALRRAASGCYGDICRDLDGEIPLEKRKEYKYITLVFAEAHRAGRINIPTWFSAHRNKENPLDGEPHPSRSPPEFDCVLKKLQSLGLLYDVAYREAKLLDTVYRKLQSRMIEDLRQAWKEAVQENTYDKSFLLAMGLCYAVFQEWWDDRYRKPFCDKRLKEFREGKENRGDRV